MIENKFLLFLMIIVTSCSNNVRNNNKNEKIEIDSQTVISEHRDTTFKQNIVIPVINSPEADTIFPDTIVNEDYMLIINNIGESKFKNIVEEKKLKKYPTSGLVDIKENYNNNAWRINDTTLIIKLRTGVTDTIIDLRSGFQLRRRYYYMDYIEEIGAHLLIGQYYEGSGYILINDSLGSVDTKHLGSNIAIDDNRQRLISFSWDGFTYLDGGFKIYDISNGGLNLIMDYRQNNPYEEGFAWCLSDVYILSPNKLLYVHQILHFKDHRIDKFCSEMTIKNNTSS